VIDRQRWLAERRHGIGGSDAPAVIGISPWRTPLDVYLEKRGESPEQEQSVRMAVGLELEPMLLRYAEGRLGVAIGNRQEVAVHPKYDWMRATLDGRVCGAVIEAKTTSSTEGWGEDGSGEVPIHYAAQVQHQMAVTGMALAYMPVLFNLSEMRLYIVERDQETIDAMIDIEARFWQQVLDGTPPEPRTAADVRRLFSNDDGGEIAADHLLLERIDRLREVRLLIRDAEAEEDRIKDEVARYMGSKAVLSHPDTGKPVITWKAAKPTVRTDWCAMAKHLAGGEIGKDLLDLFAQTTPGSRRFLIK